MSAPSASGVPDTIRTLATLVRLHEGNRDSEVNALLDRAESCAKTVEAMAEALANLRVQAVLQNKAYGNPNSPSMHAALTAAEIALCNYRGVPLL